MISNAPERSNETGLVVEHGALVVLDKTAGGLVTKVKSDAPIHGGVVIQDKWLLFGTGYQGYAANGSNNVLQIW